MDIISQAFKLFLEFACTILASGSQTDIGSKMALIQTAGNIMVTSILPHLISAADEAIFHDSDRKKD
ncbi:MAG: hypothetical protein GX858_02720 [Clostridiales bacterium]|nr:hypothetical protein [Clostridiales bacterium]